MSATPGPTTGSLNRLRALWRDSRPTFGAIATIPSAQAVQVLARSGLDWLLINLEHGPVDLGAAHAMIVATGGTDCLPLVRWLEQRPRVRAAVPGPVTAKLGILAISRTGSDPGSVHRVSGELLTLRRSSRSLIPA